MKVNNRDIAAIYLKLELGLGTDRDRDSEGGAIIAELWITDFRY